MKDFRYRKDIETDVEGSLMQPSVVLCTRSGKTIGVIKNIQGLKANHPMNDAAEISFDVYKYADGIKEPCWDYIKNFKFICLPNVSDTKYKWYEISVNIDEENDTIKHITGIHANEAELGQLMLYEVEINTENDIARDEYETITIDGKEYGTVFYCPEYPKNSLLHRILADKASHYQIIHVDDTLKNIQREFSFNGTSIIDALKQDVAQEIQCLFIFGESTTGEETNEYQRTIAVYDLLDYCEDCGERGNYSQGKCTHCGSTNIVSGYGEDSGIFINTENLTDSISFSSQTDQVKNFFRMSGGDEIMTAAIRNCNPSGSSYLTYFSDEMKEDMSDELVSKLEEYNNTYDVYLNTETITLPSSDVDAYNSLVDKYQKYSKDELIKLSSSFTGYSTLTNYDYNSVNFRDFLQTTMMPASSEVVDTTAENEIAKLTTSSMSPIGVETASTMSLTAANTAVKDYAKVYVYTPMYKIDISDSSYSNNTWRGTITLTSYTDEEDTASTTLSIAFNNNGATFIKQKIEKAMAQHKAEDIGDVSFLTKSLEEIQSQLEKYSLDALSLLESLCTAILDILTQANIGNENNELYNEFYTPYLNKRDAIIAEEKIRESEIDTIDNVIQDIDDVRNSIMDYLNMESFFGDLYPELMLYRRETEYSNSNFISDGLTDSEIIAKAQEFFKRAQDELIKASTVQHTISGDIYNLFLMPEFREVVNDNSDLTNSKFDLDNKAVRRFLRLFESGNWLRIQVDDKVYKLRMTNWEIDYDSPEKLSIEFSDVVYGNNVVSDISSVLSQARSMASSYDAVMRQAKNGNEANSAIKKTRKQGLLLNQNKIINNITEQSFVIDENGALMRARNDFDDGYSNEQVKILNKGIYYTNDGWETVKAGLGHFIYYDPDTETTKEDYGVIASTIVGQLLLGENLKIFTQSGNFKINENGLTASNGTYTVKIDPEAQTDSQIFSIYKTQTPTDKLLFVDTDGDLVVKGDINAKTLSTGSKTSSATGQNGLFIDSSGNLYSGSGNQTIIYANGEFTFGGTNGINFNGSTITLGSDCSISWNDVTDTSEVASKSDIPSDSHITQITKNTVTTAYVNALEVTAKSVAAENLTGTTISGKTISGGTITGGTIEGSTISGVKITTDTFKAKGTDELNYITLGDYIFCVHDDEGSDARMLLCRDYEQTTSGTKEYFYFDIWANQLNFWYTGQTAWTLSYTGSGWADVDGMTNFNKRVNFNYNIYDKNGNQITGSDRNIKSSISKLNIADSASFIYSLVPSKFKYLEGTSNRYHHGFIAQEVKESMGDDDWGVFIDGNMERQKMVNEKDYLGLRYAEFIADIVATIQYQKEIIDGLESRLNTLESKE